MNVFDHVEEFIKGYDVLAMLERAYESAIKTRILPASWSGSSGSASDSLPYSSS